MIKVDLTKINKILTCYYGSRNVTIYTKVSDQKFINPSEIKMLFDYDTSLEIDFIVLLRRLRRYIIGTDFFLNIIKEEGKIQVYLIVYEKPEYKDYDFEFSEN